MYKANNRELPSIKSMEYIQYRYFDSKLWSHDGFADIWEYGGYAR